MRRAVARIGRNEPCPCGSGKKYKHCCIGKDQERLHHSSDVSGHTREEVDASPEVHLTEARLAAGEPAAFVGALRLKHVTDVMRQRIGSDYRLFFRLHPDHLQVIDLINRKDFARRLKTLG